MGRYQPFGAFAVAVAVLAVTLTGVAQEQFPASATIRGENIWLRAEPADATTVLAYLQRGDAVTITGAASAAGGETFVPVEVTATGAVGWVRELAIDPRSTVVAEREERPRQREEPDSTVVVATFAPEAPPPVEITPEPTGNCDPAYPDPGVCIPPPPSNLTCDDIPYTDFTVRGRDPHGFDGDDDRVGCES